MKNYLLLAFLGFFMGSLQAQQSDERSIQKDGIQYSYQYKMLEKKKKKDQYLIRSKLENVTNESLYYEVPAGDLLNMEEEGLAVVRIHNTKGLFANRGSWTVGEKTNYKTKSGGTIYEIRPHSPISKEIKSSVVKGRTPEMTAEIYKQVGPLSNFDIDFMQPEFINGNWTADCGNFSFQLNFNRDTLNNIELTQLVNNRSYTYIHRGNQRFERADNPSYFILFAADGKSFQYTAEDGPVCSWRKN